MIGSDTIGKIVRQRTWRELLSLGTGKGQVGNLSLTREPKGWKSIGEPRIELAARSTDFGPPRPPPRHVALELFGASLRRLGLGVFDFMPQPV
jgi:hypothetical protein